MIFLLTSVITSCVMLRLMLDDISAQNTHDARRKREAFIKTVEDHLHLLRGAANTIASLGWDSPRVTYHEPSADRVVFSRKGRRAQPAPVALHCPEPRELGAGVVHVFGGTTRRPDAP